MESLKRQVRFLHATAHFRIARSHAALGIVLGAVKRRMQRDGEFTGGGTSYPPVDHRFPTSGIRLTHWWTTAPAPVEKESQGCTG
jgi:hypothetical protein